MYWNLLSYFPCSSTPFWFGWVMRGKFIQGRRRRLNQPIPQTSRPQTNVPQDPRPILSIQNNNSFIVQQPRATRAIHADSPSPPAGQEKVCRFFRPLLSPPSPSDRQSPANFGHPQQCLTFNRSRSGLGSFAPGLSPRSSIWWWRATANLFWFLNLYNSCGRWRRWLLILWERSEMYDSSKEMRWQGGEEKSTRERTSPPQRRQLALAGQTHIETQQVTTFPRSGLRLCWASPGSRTE